MIKKCTIFRFFSGDLKAIRRVTLEFSEDAAKNGTLYMEPRFCPNLMVSEAVPEVTAKHIVRTVLDALQEGEKLFGVKVYFFVTSAKLSFFLFFTFQSSTFHFWVQSLTFKYNCSRFFSRLV